MTDPVIDPPHYNDRRPQPIDVIEGWNLNFARGAAIKYIARAPYKGSELNDLRKAVWYLNREVARLEKLHAALATEAKHD